jgi:hypothetical protein
MVYGKSKVVLYSFVQIGVLIRLNVLNNTANLTVLYMDWNIFDMLFKTHFISYNNLSSILPKFQLLIFLAAKHYYFKLLIFEGEAAF